MSSCRPSCPEPAFNFVTVATLSKLRPDRRWARRPRSLARMQPPFTRTVRIAIQFEFTAFASCSPDHEPTETAVNLVGQGREREGMKKPIKNITMRLGLGLALCSATLVAASPAKARDHYHDRGNDAAIAIGAGVLGLALGAALADRDDRYYYDERRYRARRYVTVRGRPGYYYYYAGAPRRYYRDRYYSRYYAPYRRSHWRSGRGWHDDRRYRRSDRGHYAKRHYGKRQGWRDDRHYGRHDRRYDRRHDRHHDRRQDRQRHRR